MATASPRSTEEPDSRETGLAQRDLDGHGVQARSRTEIDTHGVDPAEEPSAEWGWHGGFPKASRIAGWLTAASMFFMLIGNHEGYTENVWLVAIGSCLVIALVADALKSRRR